MNEPKSNPKPVPMSDMNMSKVTSTSDTSTS